MLYITVRSAASALSARKRKEAQLGENVKVSGTVKLVLLILASVVGIYIVWKLVAGLVSAVLSLLIPLGLVLGVGYVIYLAIDRKALGGGRRRYLP
jgi:hypothetical protein